MRQKLHRTLFLFMLLVTGGLVFQSKAQAAVHNIRLYDEETETNWESDDEDIDENDLYLPGDTGKISLIYIWHEVPDRVEFTSSDASVVQVDNEGNFNLLKEGSASVAVKGWDEEGKEVFRAGYSFVVGGDVSRTALGKTSVQGYLFAQDYDDYMTDEMVVPFVNAPDLKYCSFQVVGPENSDDDFYYSPVNCRLDRERKALVITATKKGETDVTIRLNRKQFTVKVNVSTVTMKKTSALLAVKGKLRLSVKGYPGKIKWVSSNKKVASVSKKGYIKAKKKTGNTVVYAQIGDHRMGCAVSVVSPKMKKVIGTAKRIAKTCKYSQANRMSDKYYDCSSLVWKAFRKMGKTFGDANYAPVAANMAKWCAGKKKMIKGGANADNIRKMKLKPGDLVFMTGSDNSRYKGIYHVEMFVGYRCYGFQGKTPILTTCWANRFDGYGNGMKLIGRP